MKKKYWLIVLLVALGVCVVVLQLLASRINDARTDFGQESPGAFNYLLQSNRNLDAFVDVLREYQDQEPGSVAQEQLRHVYRQRFDVLWGVFSVFELKLGPGSERQQQVTDLKNSASDYLQQSEPLMAPDYELSEAEIRGLINGARAIKEETVNVGHQYFIYASRLRDQWNERLHRLYQLFWVGIFSLAITGALLLSMLVRSNRRSADLVEKSQQSQREMKHLIAELRSGKLENKAKDSFIAAASHDLRQPLHALGLYLAATEKYVASPAGLEVLGGAKHCTAELKSLFDSLLDLSRLDAGVVEVDKTVFDLDKLLVQMDQEFSALAAQLGIRFDVSEDVYAVHTDAHLLSRVLRNLLENAFTHGTATRVRVSCARKGDRLRLSVSDNGAGIPIAEQADIFAEYYQLDRPDRDRSKGLGLGLSIVKRLCDILEIDVTLESDVGSGASFHLDLPLSKAQHSGIQQDELSSVADCDVPVSTVIAIIDDDANVRQGMISMVESLGCRAIAAESAARLIRNLQLQALVPDIVVADYRLLENQTGDMAIRHVRSAFNINFPGLIITGDTSPTRVNEATQSGFDLLHKPVEPVELVRSLSKLIRAETAPAA